MNAEPLITHRPGLDGLRGLSVLGVLAFHGGFGWAIGGYLGVSVFFTLSGFLITSLLLAEQQRDGGVVLRNFWARRARRLLPAAFAALAGVGIFGITVASSGQAESLAGDVISALGYVANWRFILGGTSYAEVFAAPSPVLHFWSLAIEEQFYVFYPLLFVGVLAAARGSTRALAGVVGLLFCVSVAMSFVLGTDDLDRIYFGTDARAAEILAGALLAVLVSASLRKPATRAGPLLTGAGSASLALLIFAMATVEGRSLWLYRGGFGLVAVLSAVAILAVTRAGPLGTIVGTGPLRWFGTRSYAIYLYHWPLFLWLDDRYESLPAAPLFAAKLALTLVLAELSYRYIEQPIRSGAALRRSWPVALPSAAAVAVVLALAAGATAPAEVLVFDQGIEDVPAAPAVEPTGPPRVVVIGDSVAPLVAARLATEVTVDEDREVVDATDAECVLSTRRREAIGLLDTPAVPDGCDDMIERWAAGAAGAEAVVIALGPSSDAPAGDPQDTPADLATALSELRAALPGDARVIWVTHPLLSDDLEDGTDVAALPPGEVAAVDEINAATLALAGARGDLVVDLARLVEPPPQGYPPVRVRTVLNRTGSALADALGWVADQVLGEPLSVPVSLRILIVGDSVAYSLGRGMEAWAAERDDVVVWNAGTAGCGLLRDGEVRQDTELPISPQCRFWPDRYTQHIEAFDPDVVLVISGTWDLLERKPPGADRFEKPGEAEFDAYMASEYEFAVDVLASARAVVAWTTTPCFSPSLVEYAGVFEADRALRQNEIIFDLAESDERVELIDLRELVCRDGEFTSEMAGISDFRPDGAHFSDEGSLWVAGQLGTQLLALAGPGATTADGSG